MSLSASELLKSTADRLHDQGPAHIRVLAFDHAVRAPACALLVCVRGGGERDRTDDPLLAKQVLSQLSYTPSVSIPGGSGWARTNDPRLIKTVL